LGRRFSQIYRIRENRERKNKKRRRYNLDKQIRISAEKRKWKIIELKNNRQQKRFLATDKKIQKFCHKSHAFGR